MSHKAYIKQRFYLSLNIGSTVTLIWNTTHIIDLYFTLFLLSVLNLYRESSFNTILHCVSLEYYFLLSQWCLFETNVYNISIFSNYQELALDWRKLFHLNLFFSHIYKTKKKTNYLYKSMIFPNIQFMSPTTTNAWLPYCLLRSFLLMLYDPLTACVVLNMGAVWSLLWWFILTG